jgi:hypothetical protein
MMSPNRKMRYALTISYRKRYWLGKRLGASKQALVCSIQTAVTRHGQVKVEYWQYTSTKIGRKKLP